MSNLASSELVDAFYTLGKQYPKAQPKLSEQNRKIVVGVFNGWNDFFYTTNRGQALEGDSLATWNRYYAQAAGLMAAALKPKAKKAVVAKKPAFVVSAPVVTTVKFDNRKLAMAGAGVAIAAFIGLAASSGKVAKYA